MASEPTTWSTDDEIAIPDDPAKLWMVACGAATLVALAPVVVLAGYVTPGMTPALGIVTAIADALLFGWCLKALGVRLRHPTPAIVLGAQGISGNMVGDQLIAWDEIAGTSIGRSSGSRMLYLVPKDIDGFLARQPVGRRRWMRLNLMLCDAPTGISGAALPISLEELKMCIDERMRQRARAASTAGTAALSEPPHEQGIGPIGG